MEDKIEETVKNKKQAYWWGLEHNLVYTCGMSTLKKHIVDPNLVTIPSRRGGSVTVHGPGQLVFYSVIPLDIICGGLQAYIRFLEASIIETFWEYQILTFLVPPYSGVWTSLGKIAFVGLGLKKGIIYHGVAINLINNLNDYIPIHSCGLKLPISKLESETNIHGNKISCKKSNIVKDFSNKLLINLETRFTKKNRIKFKNNIIKKKENFPHSMLAFRCGQLFFNERRYWEAYKGWEFFWHNYREGNFKKFLGGLIQFSSALYNLTSELNLKGVLRLLNKSLNKLTYNPYINIYLTENSTQGSLIDYIKKLIIKLENKEALFKENNSITSSNSKVKIFVPYLLINKYDQIISLKE